MAKRTAFFLLLNLFSMVETYASVGASTFIAFGGSHESLQLSSSRYERICVPGPDKEETVCEEVASKKDIECQEVDGRRICKEESGETRRVCRIETIKTEICTDELVAEYSADVQVDIEGNIEGISMLAKLDEWGNISFKSSSSSKAAMVTTISESEQNGRIDAHFKINFQEVAPLLPTSLGIKNVNLRKEKLTFDVGKVRNMNDFKLKIKIDKKGEVKFEREIGIDFFNVSEIDSSSSKITVDLAKFGFRPSLGRFGVKIEMASPIELEGRPAIPFEYLRARMVKETHDFVFYLTR